MRKSQGIMIAETKEEFLAMLGKKPQSVSAGKWQEYFDVTCTFDIETTNNDDDGFAYSFQTCIGGAVVVPRYFEDWAEIMESVIDQWHITERRRLIVFVHNLGYEYTYLIQMLCERWGDCKALYTKSRKPLTLKFSNGIEFRDSLKLFQHSLAAATKGCKHEKLAGDLDYTKYRTPDTPLDDAEFSYCVNDVLGLYEAVERMKQEHHDNAATLPITNTRLVLREVNRCIDKYHDTRITGDMKSLHLDAHQTYLAYKAMAGGDTHGTRWRAGQTYTGCNSYDFKSAHPSQQLLWKFPAGEPIDLPENLTPQRMDTLIRKGLGWVGLLYLTDVSILDECPDPCISVSKCGVLNGCPESNQDNGRVLYADSLAVYCDSNDWQRVKDGYTYTEAVLLDGFAFRLAFLPDSFRMAVYEKFKIKESMKGSSEYAFAKICVNTIFGACAQKAIRDEYSAVIGDGIDFTKTSWEKNLEEMDNSEVDKKQEKRFPFLWGLWTASLTRLKLWELLKIVGWENVIYWDTDSCKYQGPKMDGVQEYNEMIARQCEKRGVVVEKKDGKKVYIGIAEDEHPGAEYGYTEFRFLHAKCYAARTCDGTLESTIAGVGKKEGQAALKNDIENLNDFLIIEDAGGQMLTYHNSPIKERHDFQRPTHSASWIVMTPRRYEVGQTTKDFTEERLG